MKPSTLQRMLTGLCVVVTSTVLYMYWAYALYQEFGWPEITLTTVLITMAALVVSLAVKAALGVVSFRVYARRHSFALLLTVVAAGFGAPALFYLTVLLNPQPDDCLGVVHFCLDFSGFEFIKTIIAIFVALEACAVLMGVIFRPAKSRPSKKPRKKT